MPRETYIFQRVEKKYLITVEQKIDLLSELERHINGDEYGVSTICSAYLDTPDFRIIRNSIDATDYKEKLRLRSYGKAEQNKTVFLEIKKKYHKRVYKRRIAVKYNEAIDYIYRGTKPCDSQIMHEIDYAMRFYDHPLPQAIICYEREAFYAKDLPAFRITFDTNIRYRRETIDLTKPTSGKLILPKGKVIMEIKTDGAMPLWMSNILDSREIFPTSFSKYGTAYQMFSKENISYDSAAYYCPDSVSLAAAN